ncbi:protein Brevis radix-like 2 [Chenopodium quinoa]|uniref:protein Brevis radix-like 2 n=1 Tax=Chenopodium quinoa TaxID=63459 RepID=UPI000B778640|nr:protein Brevis radix-like 2 [Chenopodium quinoa]
MAERLPLGAVRNSKVSVPGSPGPNLSNDVSNVMDRLNSPVAVHEIVLNWSNRHDSSNGSTTPSSRASNNLVTGQLEASCKNKNRTSDSEANIGPEWVEQDEPGVYITLVSMPNGIKDLKRVRFSRKRFSEKEAEQWWAVN